MVMLVVALTMGTVDAVAYQRDHTADLDDLLGSTPMDKMIDEINTQVEKDADTARQGADINSQVPLTRTLDADIDRITTVQGHRHRELGEGNDVSEGDAAKAAALQALHEAQSAFDKSQPTLRPQAPAKPMKAPSNDELKHEVMAARQQPPQPPQRTSGGKGGKGEPSVTKTSVDDNSDDILNTDPVDEMDSLISSEVHDSMLRNTAPRAEDPLDMAIDRIAAVRKQEKAKSDVKAKLAEAQRAMNRARESTASAVELLEEAEFAPGDPGETIPASKKAPGPPNAPVKEVEKMMPEAVPMSRSTPEVPSGAGALAAALETEKASEKAKEASEPSTGPSMPPPPAPDSMFSQDEIAAERKHIEAYPVPKNEAIAEAVSKLTPWADRIDTAKKVMKGPAAVKANGTHATATATNTTATNATATNTTGNTTVEEYLVDAA